MSEDSGDVVLRGVSVAQIKAALAEYSETSGMKIVTAPEHGSGSEDNEKPQQNEGEIVIMEGAYKAALATVKSRDKEVKKAEKSATKAMASVQTFHQQQKQLFDEFVLLRQRYDEMKQNLNDTLWGKCCEFHPDLKVIPAREDPESFLENEEQVGIYNLGRMLGEGQFATVKSCMVSQSRGDPDRSDHGKEYAMKIIEKDKIHNFRSLKRTSNEIMILHELVSPQVVSVADVIQTGSRLYIVTEKGGEDLFEFFDEHPDGVPESWAKEIMKRILKGVHYCHENQICHRDLKPENILVSFDTEQGHCDDLKLCDFGLAAHFTAQQRFTDFCGSPGFFAPEMVIKGAYFGDKADIWSCGCILLELVLGHEQFCEVWMTAYDYEVLQEKQVFVREIDATVERLASSLDFSDDLNDFVLKFLDLRASGRPDIRSMLHHPWLEMDGSDITEKDRVEKEADVSNRARRTMIEKEGNLRDQLKAAAISSLKRNKSTPHYLGETEAGSTDSERDSNAFASSSKSDSETFTAEAAATSTPGNRKLIRRDSSTRDAPAPDEADMDISDSATDDDGTGDVDPKILQKAYREISAKERKLYDQYNTDADHSDGTKAHLSLPPIEPQTPNVGQARKILLRGADLANKVSQASPSSSPSHSLGGYSAASSPIHLSTPKGFNRSGNGNSNSKGAGEGSALDEFPIGSPSLSTSLSADSFGPGSPLMLHGGRKVPLTALAETKDEEKGGSRRASSDSVPPAAGGPQAKESK